TNQSLFHVEGMRDGSRAHQHCRTDRRGARIAHGERQVVPDDSRGDGVDAGSAGGDQLIVRVKEVGWLVNLDRGLVAAAIARIAPHTHYRRVWKEQRRRVIQTRVGSSTSRGEGVGERIVEVRTFTRRIWSFVVYRSVHREHGTVR